MTDDQKAKCHKIAVHYGIANQRYKAVEEMAELIQAIMKTETEKIDYAHYEWIIEELSDVCIMVEQLRFFFGEEAVRDRIDAKLNRQLQRIEEESE